MPTYGCGYTSSSCNVLTCSLTERQQLGLHHHALIRSPIHIMGVTRPRLLNLVISVVTFRKGMAESHQASIGYCITVGPVHGCVGTHSIGATAI